MKKLLSLFLILATLTVALTGCPGAAPGPSDDPTPGPADDTVTYQADFTVVGDRADLLTAALTAAGIATGAEGATKKIVVGESTEAITATAKTELAARQDNYGDFAVLCNGTDLAVYGADEGAVRAAVAYVRSLFATDGSLKVDKTMKYLYQPAHPVITIGDKPLKDFTVFCTAPSMMADVEEFAAKLSAVCGYSLKTSDAKARLGIEIAPGSVTQATTPDANYSVAVSGTVMTISAATRSALSDGMADFAAKLTADTAYPDGYSQNATVTDYKSAPATDTALFKYCGTWEKMPVAEAVTVEDSRTMVSYWNTNYVEISFTGHSVTPNFTRATTFKVSIDGGEYSKEYANVVGELCFYAEGEGIHTLRIYYSDRSKHMYFGGVKVEAHATLSRTPDKKHYIQFIGDSISDAGTSFSHRVGDVLGWDFSVIAYGGLSLRDGSGYWKNTVSAGLASQYDENVGMESAFFRLGYPIDGDYYTEKYENHYETGNTPDIVFIFLGTNDELSSNEPKQDFVQSYQLFVEKILDTYGSDTQICILQALTTSGSPNVYRYEIIRAAAVNLMDLYPDNVNFIGRDMIETWNTQISADGTHPTPDGYTTLTNEISKVLSEYYG